MKKSPFRILWPALLLTLTLSGCRQPALPVKLTPTAAPSALIGGAPATGRIVAGGRVVPARSVALGFASGGIVTQVSVKLGEQVAAGQALAQLDTGLLDRQLVLAEANVAVAQARLDQLSHGPAEADIAAARQNVASAQATYARVAAGPGAADLAAAKAALAAAEESYAQVRAGPQAEELAQLKAMAENAKAALDQAQAAYDQVRTNPNVAMLPQSVALQQATNNHNAAIAAYQAAANHPTASELAAAAAQVQAAQAALARLTPDVPQMQAALAAVENAKAQLARLQPSADDLAVLQASLKAAQASRDLAAAQLKNATLSAPFAGAVMKLDIAPGEYAAPGAAVLLLADISAWQVETTDLTELNVAEVAEGARVTVTFDAIPGLELTGRVSMVKPYGESKQGDIVYTVNVILDRQDPRLRWNMTAKVNIESR
jgi:HlyD family secretion protein